MDVPSTYSQGLLASLATLSMLIDLHIFSKRIDGLIKNRPSGSRKSRFFMMSDVDRLITEIQGENCLKAKAKEEPIIQDRVRALIGDEAVVNKAAEQNIATGASRDEKNAAAEAIERAAVEAAVDQPAGDKAAEGAVKKAAEDEAVEEAAKKSAEFEVVEESYQESS
ncbi:hypothetical protein DFH27DRAFT_550260 [Peziza echinospora]|nr:hypothetical protein DFH27DRAFT_550260 [Peziza echinospora]